MKPSINANSAQYEIIDSDRHVSEPLEIWKEYLPKHMQKYALCSVSNNQFEALAERMRRLGRENTILLLPELQVNGKPIFDNWGEAVQIEATKQSSQYGHLIQMAASPKDQIQSMNNLGIATAYLFPTYATFIVNHSELASEISFAYAHAYNNWLYDYCTYNLSRLRGVGMISRHNPHQMREELRRIKGFGWNSIVLRPEVIQGRALGHPDYEPFWSACEEMNISIAIHGGTHLFGSTTGADRFTTHFALHACAHPMEIQMAFLSLLESGVLERHPRLKFAFLEAGASWIPFWLWRLDEICYKSMPGEVEKTIKMKPSEYFKRQCWVGFELEEPGLRQVVNSIGIDRLLYGSDFPHPDHLHLLPDHIRNSQCELDPDEVRLTQEINPQRFFGK